jgi:hypothetical protein
MLFSPEASMFNVAGQDTLPMLKLCNCVAPAVSENARKKGEP